MKRKRASGGIKQASVPLGAMGYGVAWTMDMAMHRYKSGMGDPFRDYSLSRTEVDRGELLLRIERAASLANRQARAHQEPEPTKPEPTKPLTWWQKIWRRK